jgi:glycosyltransferase involved in cell wall biosynthesis
MPVRNEEMYIERSLRSVLAQSYPQERLEIIIADGASTDATRAVIEGIRKQTSVAITIVANPKKIAPAGLNIAIAAAKGSIIIRVDGHCEIDPLYVENCVNILRSGKADGVGGPIETVGATLLSSAVAAAMSSTFGVGGSAFRTIDDREMYTDTVAFPGYTRAVLDKAGPFNEELVRNQDDEYNFRIREMGGRILLSPSIRSRYHSRSTLGSLWRQYYQYGFWKVRVLQLHPKQMSARQFVPFVFVVALIFFTVMSLVSTVAFWILIAIVSVYALANICASVYTSRNTPTAIPLVATSYLILHLSYGLGSIAGLFAFRRCWRDKPASEMSLS